MYFETASCSMSGLESRLVQVEADVTEGFPNFQIIGLADSAVKEAADRVRTAMRHGGMPLPLKRVTVNLAPAGLRKAGSAFDLAIAVAVIGAMGLVDKKDLEATALLGELSLNGNVKGVAGALPMVCHLRDQGMRRVLLPMDNCSEAMRVPDITIQPVATLREAVACIRNGCPIEGMPSIQGLSGAYEAADGGGKEKLDFADVRGQLHVRRAIEVAAAGRHHVLMMGPPGAGKTMIAQRIPLILPDAAFEEQLEVSKIYSAAGLLDAGTSWIGRRPFRAPHHTTTLAGLAGGGARPMPGEISLAHLGVLFLDEFPEFRRQVLEVLREPLQEGRITLVRSGAAHEFPADFMLAAAMNPCPCGYYPDRNRCSCSQTAIRNYLARISGPLLDRIDIQVEVEAIPFEALEGIDRGESSEAIRKRVNEAHKIQVERNSQFGARFNSQLPDRPEAWGWEDKNAKALLQTAHRMLGLSARSYQKTIKVARTIADLAGSPRIGETHIAEAIAYRFLDKRLDRSEEL